MGTEQEQPRQVAPEGGSNAETVYIWDGFVRIVHWALVALLAVVYLAPPGPAHRWLGYCVGVLVAARFVWGFIGPRHARFSDFLYPPGVMVRYVIDLLRLKPQQRRLGHSPGGGYVITAMLILLAGAALTGIFAENGVNGAWHSIFAYGALAFIGVHICGVLLRSYVYGENLIWAKVTGYKRR